ncbi:MAG: hypothetical protein F6K39_28850 [Okeania sp. SIO3B3]|nr:hypothetical protein [Okeania sp. SIO3B3]
MNNKWGRHPACGENIRNGQISGTGKYQERANIRNGQDAHSTKHKTQNTKHKTIQIIPHLCNVWI